MRNAIARDVLLVTTGGAPIAAPSGTARSAAYIATFYAIRM